MSARWQSRKLQGTCSLRNSHGNTEYTAHTLLEHCENSRSQVSRSNQARTTFKILGNVTAFMFTSPSPAQCTKPLNSQLLAWEGKNKKRTWFDVLTYMRAALGTVSSHLMEWWHSLNIRLEAAESSGGHCWT